VAAGSALLLAGLARQGGPAEEYPALLAPAWRALKETSWRQEGAVAHLPYRLRLTDREVAQAQAQVQALQLRAQSQNNLRQIGIALHNYRSSHGHFPPATVTGPDGRPLYSWRVELLPFLGHAQLYRRLRRDLPWDHPDNKKLLAKVPAVFALPGAKATDQTHYQAVVGPGAAFEGKKGVTIASFTDGTSNTLMVVETAQPVHWAAPGDLAFTPGKPLALGAARSGFNGLMADGTTHFFPANLDPMVLTALCTRAGGEVVDLSNLRGGAVVRPVWKGPPPRPQKPSRKR
jgi:hypothetical protein